MGFGCHPLVWGEKNIERPNFQGRVFWAANWGKSCFLLYLVVSSLRSIDQGLPSWNGYPHPVPPTTCTR